MIRHAAAKRGTLKTKLFDTVIIGGEDNYCAERFSYSQSSDGVRASYTPMPFAPFLYVPDAILAQYLPNLDRLFAVDSSGNHYRWHPIDQDVPRKFGTLTNERTFVVGCYFNKAQAYAVFSGKQCYVAEPNGGTRTMIDTAFHCGDWHKGRAFLRDELDPFKIVWSGRKVNNVKSDGTVYGSGYIQINPKGGPVQNIIEYGERLYLVRELAISEFVAPGDPRHFRVVTNTKFSLPKVHSDSAVICGGKLWVYTDNGIYSFNGGAVNCEYRGECKKYTVTGAISYEERFIYYNAEKDGVKMLLEYDTEKKVLTPFAKNFFGVFWMKQGLYAFYSNVGHQFKLGVEDPDRIWVSKPINFNNDKSKTLKSISVEGDGNLNIKIVSGGVERNLTGTGEIPVNLRGKSFTFTLTGACNVYKLAAHWEATHGV